MIPDLLKRKAQAQSDLLRARNHLQEKETPQQHTHAGANEVWIHEGHTEADRRRERKQRAANYRREQEAAKRSDKRSRLQHEDPRADDDMGGSEEEEAEGDAGEVADDGDAEGRGMNRQRRRRRPKSVRFP